jgi:hypothetical protein
VEITDNNRECVVRHGTRDKRDISATLHHYSVLQLPTQQQTKQHVARKRTEQHLPTQQQRKQHEARKRTEQHEARKRVNIT